MGRKRLGHRLDGAEWINPETWNKTTEKFKKYNYEVYGK